ncbi:MAG: 2-isopropylmalate synthase [Spirochaetae bacterium HGW-Spirochaetae-1]|jgi:2-isopropylmalate synthase|nr:MAG: 2-isopropylmalate synthase [Spirochaetae bacterium HGW-Spirochaetae-1]
MKDKTDKDKIIIFDTTLRDGEQSPGFSMNMEEKLIFAEQLERLGVDVIEAGFPVISDGDFDSVKRIAERLKNVQVAGLARANVNDIDAAARALEKAKHPRIHTFISSSDIHIIHQFRKTREEVLELAINAVRHAVKYMDNVEFSPMDATRSDLQYLATMVYEVIAAGATTVNIPDTVGYTVPSEFHRIIKYLFDNVSNIGKAVISVHCHNDLGLAVANSLAAVEAGARQVECTVNGIGERAGNTAMEEIVMAVRTRSDVLHVNSTLNTRQIMATSKLLTHITGVSVQPNKAIVGDNAFAHESGIHQDGLLKNSMTYEIMKPEDVGISKSTLVLGKHSGRHAVMTRLHELGFDLSQEELDRFFKYFKILADKKKQIYDEDLIALIGEAMYKEEKRRRYKVQNVQISTGMFSPPMTMVTLKDHDTNRDNIFEVAHGNGGVDAGVKAVKKITDTNALIKSFNLVAITGGSDALSEVTATVVENYNGRELKVFGNGTHVDISIAGIISFVDALNKLEYMKKVNQNHVGLQDMAL